jgi:hypothetical protein
VQSCAKEYIARIISKIGLNIYFILVRVFILAENSILSDLRFKKFL